MKKTLQSLTLGLALLAGVQFATAGEIISPASVGVYLQPKVDPALAPLNLASDGKALYRIVTSAKPSAQETLAAGDLAMWLHKISGATFQVLREGGKPIEGGVISIGDTALMRAAGLPAVDLKQDGYRLAFRDGTLFITGGSRQGVVNGVYALLEEDLGCRWYQPGPDGMVIPKHATLTLQPAPRSFVSPFDQLRRIDYADVNNGDWQRQNRVRNGIWDGYFVHTYNHLMPPKDYFAPHPDYFSMINGKRVDKQLCPTHPEVRELILIKIRDRLRKNPKAEYIAVDPNDGGGACHCPTCQALIDREGTEMGPLLDLVNTVAAGIRDEFPQVRVTTLAYLNTVVPPKTFGPATNALTWFATDAHAWGFGDLFVWETDKSSQAMQAWFDRWKSPLIVWDYPSLFHASQVNFDLPVIAPNLQWFAKHGASGIYFQTVHNNNFAADHSYQRSWIFSKLGWNPDLDVQALVRDFNAGFYGAAAPHMQAYDDMLWNEWKKWHAKTTTEFPTPWNRDEARKEKRPGRVKVDPAFWETAEKHLLAAENAVADNEILRRRVRTARLPFQYMKLEKGPGQDVAAYSRMISDYEADAKAAKLIWVENFVCAYVKGGDLPRKVFYWQKLTLPPPTVPFRELDNSWRFAPDLENKGLAERWFEPDYPDLAWATLRSDTGTGWEQNYKNLALGWYRQTFNVTEEMMRRPTLWLLFGAVDEEAEVFINGKLAFEHTTKSTGLHVTKLWEQPFVFDARPFVKAGANTLAVRVTNSAAMAGIWRPVWFILQNAKPDPKKTLEEIELIKTKEKLKR